MVYPSSARTHLQAFSPISRSDLTNITKTKTKTKTIRTTLSSLPLLEQRFHRILHIMTSLQLISEVIDIMIVIKNFTENIMELP